MSVYSNYAQGLLTLTFVTDIQNHETLSEVTLLRFSTLLTKY